MAHYLVELYTPNIAWRALLVERRRSSVLTGTPANAARQLACRARNVATPA